MKRKVNRVSAKILKDHTILVTENGAEVTGCNEEFIEESKYHSNRSYSKVSLIGEFSVEDDSISEDTIISNQISYKKKTLNYQILVYDKEGPIPHFHVKGKDGNVDVCICIFEPRYFDHRSHVGTLNSKELKVLDGFLRSECNSITKNTYWGFIVDTWCYNNRYDYNKYPQIIVTDKQPDYTHMLGYKSGR